MSKVAFFPYTRNEVSYIHTMQKMLESRFEVIDYTLVKNGWYDIGKFRALYLNWIEGNMDEKDRNEILRARQLKLKVVWVFHNKVKHDDNDVKHTIQNIQFLIRNCPDIIIHSRSSLQILIDYEPLLDKEKVHYIPHPNYIGDYFDYKGIADVSYQPQEFVFGFLGQIRPYKNIEVLIEAFKQADLPQDCRLFIAGRPINLEYQNYLKSLAGACEKIDFIPKYISDIQMKRYVELADVVVAPFSVKSSMNSGTMILAYSYGRTTLTPQICMTEDFPAELIYQYHYTTKEEHILVLREQMKAAYRKGKEINAEKGRQLKEIVARDYSKERVKKELLALM